MFVHLLFQIGSSGLRHSTTRKHFDRRRQRGRSHLTVWVGQECDKVWSERFQRWHRRVVVVVDESNVSDDQECLFPRSRVLGEERWVLEPEFERVPQVVVVVVVAVEDRTGERDDRVPGRFPRRESLVSEFVDDGCEQGRDGVSWVTFAEEVDRLEGRVRDVTVVGSHERAEDVCDVLSVFDSSGRQDGFEGAESLHALVVVWWDPRES